jgi:dTDP-4-dehydrorhamnose 3,5-epimerase
VSAEAPGCFFAEQLSQLAGRKLDMSTGARRFSIAGPLLITPRRHGDERGFFSETYSARALEAEGVTLAFVQDNHVLTEKAGTVRGLHFQAPPHAQDKLVRVTRGRIFDVAVDIRRGSPAYGRHVAAELSAEAWNQLLVPKGFAHGYCTLEPGTEVIYKTSDFYAPQSESGFLWNDPSLGIPWPEIAGTVVSERDAKLSPFGTLQSPFNWEA